MRRPRCVRRWNVLTAFALAVPLNSALLFVERTSYSQQDFPVEVLRMYYRGDRYSLYTELQG